MVVQLKPELAGSILSSKGLLVILPSTTDVEADVRPDTLLCGLPVLRRLMLVAVRAGFARVLVGRLRPEHEALLSGTPGEALVPNAPRGGERAHPSRPLSAGRVVFLTTSVVPQPEWLRRLREMPIEPERLYAEDGSIAVVDVKNSDAVVAVAARSGTLAETVRALRGSFKVVDSCFDDQGRFFLETSRDLPAAERWLLRGLIKSSEGLMSRHLERRISLALTKRLCATPITPNAMTLVSLGIGLTGALFFLSMAAGYQMVGALLFIAHSILDGCDGELARLKFLESRSGAILDFWGDNVVHVMVFTCMAVGWSYHAGAAWPLLLGAVAVVSTAGTAAIVYRRGMRASVGDGPPSLLSRLGDSLVSRDFIYVILLLAVVGRAFWFLAVVAVGAPLFLALLAWVGRPQRTE